MGGDCIGSSLVELSTGIDFVRAVIEIALGQKPDLESRQEGKTAAVRFVFSEKDLDILAVLKKEHPEYLVEEDVQPIHPGIVTDSSARFGYYLMKADNYEALLPYLPEENEGDDE